jgi:hypothetical protein
MCVGKTNGELVRTLFFLGFQSIDCPISDFRHNRSDHRITQVIHRSTDSFLFFINLSLLGDTLVIRFFNVITNACDNILGVNIPETFETTKVHDFCKLQSISEFIDFINTPSNNARQV